MKKTPSAHRSEALKVTDVLNPEEFLAYVMKPLVEACLTSGQMWQGDNEIAWRGSGAFLLSDFLWDLTLLVDSRGQNKTFHMREETFNRVLTEAIKSATEWPRQPSNLKVDAIMAFVDDYTARQVSKVKCGW